MQDPVGSPTPVPIPHVDQQANTAVRSHGDTIELVVRSPIKVPRPASAPLEIGTVPYAGDRHGFLRGHWSRERGAGMRGVLLASSQDSRSSSGLSRKSSSSLSSSSGSFAAGAGRPNENLRGGFDGRLAQAFSERWGIWGSEGGEVHPRVSSVRRAREFDREALLWDSCEPHASTTGAGSSSSPSISTQSVVEPWASQRVDGDRLPPHETCWPISADTRTSGGVGWARHTAFGGVDEAESAVELARGGESQGSGVGRTLVVGAADHNCGGRNLKPGLERSEPQDGMLRPPETRTRKYASRHGVASIMAEDDGAPVWQREVFEEAALRPSRGSQAIRGVPIGSPFTGGDHLMAGSQSLRSDVPAAGRGGLPGRERTPAILRGADSPTRAREPQQERGVSAGIWTASVNGPHEPDRAADGEADVGDTAEPGKRRDRSSRRRPRKVVLKEVDLL